MEHAFGRGEDELGATRVGGGAKLTVEMVVGPHSRYSHDTPNLHNLPFFVAEWR
jgi:hypothetical protein